MSFLGGSAGGGFKAQGPDEMQMKQAADEYQKQLAQQNAFTQALQGQQGISNQSNLYNQFQNMAAGQGPNAAQSMLSNATGTNVANQAALMAGQRGANSNAGLLARQAAMQGGAIQQSAAGQAAALQAQQTMGALGQASNIAGQQVGNLAQANQTGLSSTLQNQQQLMGAQSSANSANAEIAKANQGSASQALGGLMQGLGTAAMMFINKGGEVPDLHHYADGGFVSQANKPAFGDSGGSSFSKAMNSMSQQQPQQYPQQSALGNLQQGSNTIGKAMGSGINAIYNAVNPAIDPNAQGVQAPASLENNMKYAAHGGVIDYRTGGNVPGRAAAKGDSLKNDTQPAMLSPKEIVLPRSVTLAEDAPKKAAEFVRAILARKGLSK